MVEVALAVATIARRVGLRLAPGHRAEGELLGTLHPRPGILMTAEWRPTPAAARSTDEGSPVGAPVPSGARATGRDAR
jgi:hypothetical protein